LQQSIGDEGEIALQDVIEDVNTVDVNHMLIIESAVATIYALVKPKERKILSLIKNGYSNKEIATMLNVEPKAVTGLKKKLNENSEVRRAVKRAGYLGGLYDEK
jgi:DNA-binding NarL/FixJ family response regulator